MTYGEELRSNSLFCGLLAVEKTHGGVTGDELSRVLHGKFVDRGTEKKDWKSKQDRLFQQRQYIKISSAFGCLVMDSILPQVRTLPIRAEQNWGAAWDMSRSVLRQVCPVPELHSGSGTVEGIPSWRMLIGPENQSVIAIYRLCNICRRRARSGEYRPISMNSQGLVRRETGHTLQLASSTFQCCGEIREILV